MEINEHQLSVQDKSQELSPSIIDELIDPNDTHIRLIIAVLAVLFALISFFVLGLWASSPDTYASTIASLDAKRATVMNLVAGSTGTSAAITLLPGDIGTPIAEQLLDLGSGFAIVLGAIYLYVLLSATSKRRHEYLFWNP